MSYETRNLGASGCFIAFPEGAGKKNIPEWRERHHLDAASAKWRVRAVRRILVR